MTLRIELTAAAVVHWSADAWNTVVDTPTVDTSLGVHFADLPTAALHAGTTLRFTFRWCDEDRWQGEDYACVIVAGTVERASSSGAPSADGGVHVAQLRWL